MGFNSPPHHTKLTETGSLHFLIPVQIGIEILIDLVSSWFASWLEKMEDKVMSIVISSLFKFLCLVVAMGACAVAVAYTRHYKRAFQNEVPFCSMKISLTLDNSL